MNLEITTPIFSGPFAKLLGPLFGRYCWHELLSQDEGGPIPWDYNFGIPQRYCWWLKSCTSWYGKYPIIYRVSYIPGGAGFQQDVLLTSFFLFIGLGEILRWKFSARLQDQLVAVPGKKLAPSNKKKTRPCHGDWRKSCNLYEKSHGNFSYQAKITLQLNKGDFKLKFRF